MRIFLMAAFIGVPLLEIAVFIQVGGLIGLWPTLGLVVLTAVLGAWELRAQGLATLARARAQVDQGQLPTAEIFEGACLLVAGALLLTPGFVTDAVGVLLFLAPVRTFLRERLARHLRASVKARVFVSEVDEPGGQGRGPILEGEFDDVTDESRRSAGGGWRSGDNRRLP